jgi:hypothetical protein
MKNFIYSCFFVLFVTSFLSAQTPQAKVFTEPVTPHSLSTLGLTTNSVSPGLPVFANGTYLYVSAKEVRNGQTVLTSVFNLIQRPAGSTAVLEDLGIDHWKGLKADVKGAYKIEVTLTTAGGTDQDTGTFYAGDYMGIGTVDGVPGAFPSCETCHSSNAWFTEIKGRWETSGHATIFRNQIDAGAAYYSTACMKCHTTGYDHHLTAANNGFDDVAAALGWVWVGPPAPGKWAALKTTYPGLVKFATIGCENCHGAGSNHPSNGQPGSAFTTLSTLSAGACAQCHDEPWRHNKYAQFENSGHADIVFERTTGTSANTNNLSDCVRCHDARGYINYTKGLTTNAITWTDADHTSITCAACHDPHGNSNVASIRVAPTIGDTLANGYAYTRGGIGKTCMNCHKSRRNVPTYVVAAGNVTATYGPHYLTAADVFFGQNAADFGSGFLSNSHQFAITDACVTCHMVATTDTGTVNRDKVGGHTFSLVNPDNGYEHTTACTSCHGPKASFNDFIAATDYDQDGTVEGIPDEVQGLYDLITLWLPPVGQPTIDYAAINALTDLDYKLKCKRALYNMNFMKQGSGKGMHNSKFTFDVLTKSVAALGGIIPVELVSFKAEVGKNGVTLNWETATETNNLGFEIERMINGNWSKIGFVEGNGTTTEFNTYSYSDKPSTSGNVSYRLKQVDYDGSFTYSKVVDVDFNGIPTEFSLLQNYPNPFNPSTVIRYALPFDSKVNITIYNINGEVVKVLADGEFTAGQHEAQFSINSANGIASGVYLYSIKAVSTDGKSNFVQTKKMVLIK